LSRRSSRFRGRQLDIVQGFGWRGLSSRASYDQEAGDRPRHYAEQEFDYGRVHGAFFLVQWDIHAIVLGAFAADDPTERGFLDSVETEYLPATVSTDNHTLAHSPRPSIVKEPRVLIPRLLPIPMNRGNSQLKYGGKPRGKTYLTRSVLALTNPNQPCELRRNTFSLISQIWRGSR
jgi:hypothetical protein